MRHTWPETDHRFFLDPEHPFSAQYEGWLRARDGAKGYDFGQAPCGSVSPSPVRFEKPLRWRSLDRARRIAAHLRWRDRRVEEIVSVGAASRSEAGWPAAPPRESNASQSIALLTSRRHRVQPHADQAPAYRRDAGRAAA